MTTITKARLRSLPTKGLLATLTGRFSNPEASDPPLSTRLDEAAEDLFVDMATGDDQLRERLEEAARLYFSDSKSDTTSEATVPVTLAMLHLVQRLVLSGTSAPLRAWLEREKTPLRKDPEALLAREALGALAVTQTPGLAPIRDFWLHLVKTAPVPWRPRAFIGLRLCDPSAAVREVPNLLKQLKARGDDPGPLLAGLWQQETARVPFETWLREPSNEHASQVSAVLTATLMPDAQSQLQTLIGRREVPPIFGPVKTKRPTASLRQLEKVAE